MLGDALAVLAVGTVVGLGVALVLSRRLAPLLYEVEPWDLVTMLAVCAVLLGVGVLAALLPARRATSADPMEVLRAD